MAEPYTNFGRCVDIYAPGGKILSAFPRGNSGYLSGTSTAAPHLTGVLAILMGQGNSAAESRRFVLETATKGPIRNGKGSTVNLLLYFQGPKQSPSPQLPQRPKEPSRDDRPSPPSRLPHEDPWNSQPHPPRQPSDTGRPGGSIGIPIHRTPQRKNDPWDSDFGKPRFPTPRENPLPSGSPINIPIHRGEPKNPRSGINIPIHRGEPENPRSGINIPIHRGEPEHPRSGINIPIHREDPDRGRPRVNIPVRHDPPKAQSPRIFEHDWDSGAREEPKQPKKSRFPFKFPMFKFPMFSFGSDD
jgi:hypothetical protein